MTQHDSLGHRVIAMRRGGAVIRLIAVVCLASGCSAAAARTPGDGLPFYDGPDFTPRWTSTVAHTIGDFALVTQTGEPLTRDDLIGRPHVASFFFTKCGDVCPLVVSQLSHVQASIQDRYDVLLVSYSVTPEVDTPEILSDFAAGHGIDAETWKLVTGEAETIYGLARESYFADDGRLGNDPSTDALFLHTEKMLLVDAEGRLRGIYNGTLPYETAKLIADIETLIPIDRAVNDRTSLDMHNRHDSPHEHMSH
jgi:protein SCO1/2